MVESPPQTDHQSASGPIDGLAKPRHMLEWISQWYPSAACMWLSIGKRNTFDYSLNTLEWSAEETLAVAREDIPLEHVEWFVFLHEIGHWWDVKQGHRPDIAGLSVAQALQWRDRGAAEDLYINLRHEKAADAFALTHLNKRFHTTYQHRYDIFDREKVLNLS